MTGQNIRLADPIIAKGPVGRFRIGPVLASPRRRQTYTGRQLLQELPKSLAVTRILELTAYNFAIDPFLPTEILRRFPGLRAMGASPSAHNKQFAMNLPLHVST